MRLYVANTAFTEVCRFTVSVDTDKDLRAVKALSSTSYRSSPAILAVHMSDFLAQ